jgi:hypothetical protein
VNNPQGESKGTNMAVSLDEVRVARFVATMKVLSDFAQTNPDFFSDLEVWERTREMSDSILAFIDAFKLFTTDERGRFVEFLKVLSEVLEGSD